LRVGDVEVNEWIRVRTNDSSPWHEIKEDLWELRGKSGKSVWLPLPC